MSKKSFLQNIWHMIIGGSASSGHKQISSAQAAVLQKKYLEAREDEAKILEYPPYVDVARQLFSDKKEIFRAAVFYLRRIAENENKYAEAIVTVMKQYAKTAERNAEDMAFLAEQIDAIEKNVHFFI
ncbi:MAG: hypothetical protein Q4D80_00480 [Pseudomonadota bacterium]|nr:hypothetical protein [Pseudomonadota bacterium]